MQVKGVWEGGGFRFLFIYLSYGILTTIKIFRGGREREMLL